MVEGDYAKFKVVEDNCMETLSRKSNFQCQICMTRGFNEKGGNDQGV